MFRNHPLWQAGDVDDHRWEVEIIFHQVPLFSEHLMEHLLDFRL